MLGTSETGYLRTQLLERRERLAGAVPSAQLTAEISSLLFEVDAALRRMDEGTYGICETCHDSIEADRLMADPLTRFCIDHLSEIDRAALERDLSLAGQIQAALLPDRQLTAEEWESGYHYEPAGAVSGDYCDLVTCGDGRVCVFTGDISGKGVAASLLMSNLHAIVRTLLSLDTPLEQLLERANRLFCESTLPSSYATLACGRAGRGGEIDVINAGHCPPLWVRKRETTAIPATGLPLGMFCGGRFATQRLTMEAGDVLVFYTDGLTEARNGSDEEYGEERLMEVVRGCHGAPPRSVLGRVLEDVRRFRGKAPAGDDLTMLVLARRGRIGGNGLV